MLHRGRLRVPSSSEAIERVAGTTGFRDPERMRRAFIRAFGQPPQSPRGAGGVGRGLTTTTSH
jgi:transcriptional regulator GlxA family with amidase domain